jgi:hypothetical protein
MIELTYSALVFIPKTTEILLEDTKNKFFTFFNSEKFPEENIQILLSKNEFIDISQIELKINSWFLYITLNYDPYVSKEAIEIAEKYIFEDHDRKASLENCNSRFEVYSDPDPNMDYFNFYVWVVELLCEYKGAVAFDPQSLYFI